jgi:TATA-binding protein-associated factor
LQALKALATEEDLAQLTRLYQEYFAEDNNNDSDCLIISPEKALSFNLKNVDEGDLGMEVECSLDPTTLAHNLGFVKRNLPHQFMSFRHRSGITAWDDATQFQEPPSDFLQPTYLHWHQLAGVHSIIRNTLESTPSTDNCTGMLVCDEVGLGKTALSISTIAFLNQAMFLQDRGQTLPPILRKCAQPV